MTKRTSSAKGVDNIPRRSPSAKRSDRIDELVTATIEELRESGYEAFTVRNAARRANVAPATAYTYFASKDHLIAEAFWRRMKTVEATWSRRSAPASRLEAVSREIAAIYADEPALAAAASRAFAAREPDVDRLRNQVTDLIREQLTLAMGDHADPRVVGTLVLVLMGAFQVASAGGMRYGEVAESVAAATELLVN